MYLVANNEKVMQWVLQLGLNSEIEETLYETDRFLQSIPMSSNLDANL